MCLTTIVLTVFICIIIIQSFIICVQGDKVCCCVAWANGFPATLTASLQVHIMLLAVICGHLSLYTTNSHT